ncbi:MAG TPA: palindromic element RPE4 domain-containing protein [Rickettsia endosymbiont of Columbicola hoogstraali]|nr:palindromic element RPE4 domain-containing protein [Rickettsia endosymbiont of Columbicola hoogstraali]
MFSVYCFLDPVDKPRGDRGK